MKLRLIWYLIATEITLAFCKVLTYHADRYSKMARYYNDKAQALVRDD